MEILKQKNSEVGLAIKQFKKKFWQQNSNIVGIGVKSEKRQLYIVVLVSTEIRQYNLPNEVNGIPIAVKTIHSNRELYKLKSQYNSQPFQKTPKRKVSN